MWHFEENPNSGKSSSWIRLNEKIIKDRCALCFIFIRTGSNMTYKFATCSCFRWLVTLSLPDRPSTTTWGVGSNPPLRCFCYLHHWKRDNLFSKFFQEKQFPFSRHIWSWKQKYGSRWDVSFSHRWNFR